MGSDLAVHGETDLSFGSGQTFFTEKQIAALRQLGVEGATNGDLAVFFHVAARTGLDPFAKQIYLIGRKTKRGMVQTIQTGIDGFRVVARRAADFANESLEYEDTLWCGEDGKWRDTWLSKDYPAAAKVVVLRDGKRYPAVAHWKEYVQTNYEGEPNQFWSRGPANQLAKCAEALALRKAFPHDLSGVHTDDEVRDEPAEHSRPVRERSGSARLRTAIAPTVDAEAEPAEPDPPADMAAEPIRPGQVTSLQILAQQKGFRDRTTRLSWASQVVEFDLKSFKDLTVQEAATVRAALEELPDVT